MTNARESNHSFDSTNGGIRLVVMALVLGALALVVDLAWMTPHQSSLYTPANATVGQAATSEQPSTTTYFPSQFTLQAKEIEEQPPTF